MTPARFHTILLASDDLDARHVAAMALRAVGPFEVLVCGLGDALCAFAQSDVPDLIVLDVGADERPALASLARLGQIEAVAAVPVVLLAAPGGPDQQQRYRARGALGTIAKPYRPIALAEQLRALWRDAAAPGPRQPQQAAPGPGPRVLIVEDEPLQRALLAAALRHAGVLQLQQAADGAEALALLAAAGQQGQRLDLVITDVRMDGMDGIEFLRAAQSFQVGAFALSSALDAALLASTEAVVRANGIALAGVLAKPVAPAALLALLAGCAERETGAEVLTLPALQSAWGVADLERALDGGQFVPFFQPKFDLASKRLDGVEVLARWLHPELGMLPPSEFIDVMEQNGLIDRLTDSILAQALACLRAWDAQGCVLDLAVNLSARTLENLELPNRLRDFVAGAGIAAGRITFEMTETAVSERPHVVLESVTRLRVLGFKVSIDDFGLGYSSLAQLSTMPFSELKIDRSFVMGMPKAGKTLAILESTLALAARLGLRTVAEGIETAAECEFLRSLGCVAGQGYWYARPMSQSEMLAWYGRQAKVRA